MDERAWPAWTTAGRKRSSSLLGRLSTHVGMGPRKKSKPNSQVAANASNPGPGSGPASNTTTAHHTPSGSEISQKPPSSKSRTHSSTISERTASTTETDGQTLKKKASRKWLGASGSWRVKAPAIVGGCKEHIGVGVAGGVPGELPKENTEDTKPQSPAKFLTKRKSSKGDAIPAAMTKFHVNSDGSIAQEEEKPGPSNETTEPTQPTVDEPPLPPDPPKEQKSQAPNTLGWRGWWSRPDGYSETTKAKASEEAQATPLPGPTPSEEVDAKSKELREGTPGGVVSASKDTEMKDPIEDPAVGDQDTETKDAPPATSSEGQKNTSSTSWFWLWSSAQNAQANPNPNPATEIDATKPSDQNEAAKPFFEPNVVAGANPPPTEPTADSTTPAGDTESTSSQSPKASGWAFWFSSKPKTEENSADGAAVKQVGEVAVYDTPSQSHPEAAQFNEQEQHKEEPPQEPPKQVIEESIAKRSFRSLRGRSKVKQTPKDTPTDTPTSSKTATPSKTSPTHSPTRPETAPAAQPAPKGQVKTKQEPPNLILPEFRNTYHLVQKPTYWQQVRKYFLGDEPAQPHLHINPAPPRIKRAVAIGIHGFFPAPIIQRVLGPPTGTSIRFANAAREAIDEWTKARGYTAEIEQIALEGEGVVADRVKTLWKLLLNWIDHIKEADFVLVACHSQGVPVAIMLVAKLIQFGCVNAARIGVCAMAGINLGPFAEYKTKYFGAIAAELFEFSNPKSLVSQMYLAALDEVLRYGVRILYVGSIDDQLVSLESSTFSNISHPYIYRAVFVDGRIHAPDFLTHLVGFALKLRNLGLPDHGLIRELSPALAGSLYGGEGHSRLYDEPHVYRLAVHHALETTSLPIAPQQRRPSTSASLKAMNIPVPGAKADEKNPYALQVKDYDAVGSGNQNPFFLPWAMRGLLEEEFVKKELGREVEELLGMFEDWKPQGKQLKDVKFRLEGVRSRL